MIRGFFCSMVLVIAGLPSPAGSVRAQDQDRPSKDVAALMSGTWKGSWISLAPKSAGYVFLADLQVTIDARNNVEGKINWKLQKAPAGSHLSDRVGQTAVEHVRGVYYPRARAVILDGFKKDDPSSIIGLDRYRLILSDNLQILGGITNSHDTWEGLIQLRLKK